MKQRYALSSRKWLKRHFTDQYVRSAHKMKLRSRAWFKLHQLNSIDSLLYPGMNIVDLGSTPGSWSKYAKEKIGKKGRIIACDILPMDSIIGVDFLKGDFCDPKIFQQLITWVDEIKADVVLSDMSPKITGIASIDVSKSIYLGEMALVICEYILIIGGSFVVKVFQGEGFNEYFGNVRVSFNTVKIRKPDASRVHSREVYIVAKGYKM